MIYATLTIVVAFYSLLILYCRRLFPIEASKYIPFPATAVGIVCVYILLDYFDVFMIELPCMAIVLIIGLRFSTGMKWRQAVCGGCTCLLFIHCLRMILTTAYAFFSFREEQGYFYQSDIYYKGTFIVLLIITLLICLEMFSEVISIGSSIKFFLCNSRELIFTICYGSATIVEVTLMNIGRFQSPTQVIYISVVLGTSIINLGVLLYLIYHSVKSYKLFEYKIRAELLEEQYIRQLTHYNSLQQYTKRFREFKHDYKSMTKSLKALIEIGENEKAIQLLESMDDTVRSDVQMREKYSDNVVLDSMLQDLAEICEKQDINFSFQVKLSKKLALSLMDSIRVFSNVINNAIEACNLVPFAQRFIEIRGCYHDGWSVMWVKNSFNGKPKRRGNIFLTTHQDKKNHGLGLGIVKEIIEASGGFLIIESDLKNNIFVVQMHVPDFNE